MGWRVFLMRLVPSFPNEELELARDKYSLVFEGGTSKSVSWHKVCVDKLPVFFIEKRILTRNDGAKK